MHQKFGQENTTHQKTTHELIILGCGSSGGVPRLGVGYGNCDPNNPKNNRMRCSVLINLFKNSNDENLAKTILIDTSPDIRTQLLRADAKRLDYVLITHEHADHTHGLDDLRPFSQIQKQLIPIYTDKFTMQRLIDKFGYCFMTPQGSSYPPIISAHEIKPFENLNLVEGVKIIPVEVNHGDINALGFRINDLFYLPDVKFIDDKALSYLQNLDTLIIDGLQDKIHVSHFTVADALEAIAEIKPKRAILTNMHISLDYEELKKRLPDGVEPAYDGMVVNF